MTSQTRATLKGYFNTNDQPTEAQFVDLIDSAVNVSEEAALFPLLAGRAGGQTLYGGTGANDDITIHGTSDATRTTSYVLLQPTAGNVGIGTTSPATALHVVGAATITGGIRPAADSTTALQLQTAAGTPVVTVDTTNGRVGIGTTSPGAPLHVVHDSGYTSDVGSALKVGSKTTPAQRIGLGYDGTADFGFIQSTQESVGVKPLALNPSGGTVGIGYAAPGTTAALAINGNVGISTTLPATRLDIDAGALTMKEMTAPSGVADKAMLYTKDNGAGKTQLCCKLGDDVEIVLATQA